MALQQENQVPLRHLAELARPEPQQLLKGILRGIEKESLRVTHEGQVAQTPHPQGLGSALTHESITTDFSEALLEFITPPVQTPEEALYTLDQIHRFTYAEIGAERLWVNSMPGFVGEDRDIPVARYGKSHIGHMKSAYRLGLSLRYGRKMQAIAGIHYNFSLPDEFWLWLKAQESSDNSEVLSEYKTRRYFDLIRNFRRHYWLLIYLFGAAPAVSDTFVQNRDHKLQPFAGDPHSLCAPQGTSLRMGDLGYSSDAQRALIVCYNSLPDYLSTLCAAIQQPYPPYQQQGLRDAGGSYQQLSTGLLQIENEFYSPIRPKNPAKMGEAALSALDSRGVEYIEVRCLDLNPFMPLGIDGPQMRFLDTFLLHCLLRDSPIADSADYRAVQENQQRIVYRGRDPQLRLIDNGAEIKLTEWAQKLLDEMSPLAQLFDDTWEGRDYQSALALQRAKLAGDLATPASQMLAEMRQNQQTFIQWAVDKAEQHRKYFVQRPLEARDLQKFAALARESRRQQQKIEEGDRGSFTDFLRRYYAQYAFCCQSASAS